jgi:hypothetical protein
MAVAAHAVFPRLTAIRISLPDRTNLLREPSFPERFTQINIGKFSALILSGPAIARIEEIRADGLIFDDSYITAGHSDWLLSAGVR